MPDSLLLPPAFDLDTGAEIVDEETVRILASGRRKVASTTAERLAAIHLMAHNGEGVRVIANNIGISIDAAKQLIAEAGFEIKPDPMFRRPSGADGNRTYIVKAAA